MWLSWATFFEGNSDREYLSVLIQRLLTEIILNDGRITVNIPDNPIHFGIYDRNIDSVAKEACDNRNLFHIWFIHTDNGGRSLERTIKNRCYSYAETAFKKCGLPLDRSVFIIPKKETESWVICDKKSLYLAFGLNSSYNDDSIPRNPIQCESIRDPKEAFNSFAKRVNSRRYKDGASFMFTNIALNQDLNVLRQLPSFQNFEQSLRRALKSLGCI